MKILGIDPGHSRIGYGIISTRSDITLIDAGVIEIASKEMSKKLFELARRLSILIKKHRPDLLALETLFFSKNKTTALRVAEARGVILLIAAQNNIAVRELNPMSVKKIIGGHGTSDKASLARFIERLLNTKLPKGPDDISDAVAIALAGALSFPLDPHTKC